MSLLGLNPEQIQTGAFAGVAKLGYGVLRGGFRVPDASMLIDAGAQAAATVASYWAANYLLLGNNGATSNTDRLVRAAGNAAGVYGAAYLLPLGDPIVAAAAAVAGQAAAQVSMYGYDSSRLPL